MKSAAVSVFACLFVGCLHPRPIERLDGNWGSPLDADLRSAAVKLEDKIKSNGWPIDLLWAGVRENEYQLERSPTGEPLRKFVHAVYVYENSQTHKCYMNGNGSMALTLFLVQEHIGGGRYAPPQINGYDPVAPDGDMIGDEMVCAGVASINGGVRAPFDGASAAP